MEIFLLSALVIFTAYFLKGFTGFGPALVMVPFFTILYDPGTAISAATLFDFLAGAYLIVTIRKQLHWRFVLQIFSMIAIGAVLGSLLLGKISEYWLEKAIGLAIFVFAVVILFQKNGDEKPAPGKLVKKLKYPVGFFGGFLGGFLGITGPPIIIYLKLLYEKSYFRTQLIGVFFFGAGWRFILYRLNNLPMNIDWLWLIVFTLIMFIAAFIGSHLQSGINETNFNRIVAVILFIPSLNLLLN